MEQVAIDIGGEKRIRVSVDLFAVAGDNKFASLFSGRWQEHLDAEGCYFVDYSPTVFMPLIEWLRLLRDSEPEAVAPVIVEAPHLRAWVRMVLVSSFHPQVLRKAALSVRDLDSCGCGVRVCMEAGFEPRELVAVFKQKDFQKAGLSGCELRKAGFSARDLREAYFSNAELRESGFTPLQLKDAGFAARILMGRDFQFSVSELKEAGFAAWELADPEDFNV